MLSSISRQNEWGVRHAAPPRPPVVQPSQDGGSDSGGTEATGIDPSTSSRIAGTTGSPLSMTTSLMLMMFSRGEQPSHTGASLQTGSAAPSPEANNDAADAQDVQDGGSPLAQSLTAALADGTGVASATTRSGHRATSADSSRPNTPPSTEPDLDGGTILASATATQPSRTRGSQPTLQPADGGSSSKGSVLPHPPWHNGWDGLSGPGSSWRQQPGLAAYAVGNASSAIATLGSIDV
jgi:hypothetical protein